MSEVSEYSNKNERAASLDIYEEQGNSMSSWLNQKLGPIEKQAL